MSMTNPPSSSRTHECIAVPRHGSDWITNGTGCSKCFPAGSASANAGQPVPVPRPNPSTARSSAPAGSKPGKVDDGVRPSQLVGLLGAGGCAFGLYLASITRVYFDTGQTTHPHLAAGAVLFVIGVLLFAMAIVTRRSR